MTINVQVSAAARKITFWWEKNITYTSVNVFGSGGQDRNYPVDIANTVNWTLFTIDLDAAPYLDAAYWFADFITSIRFNGGTYGVIAIDDFKIN